MSFCDHIQDMSVELNKYEKNTYNGDEMLKIMSSLILQRFPTLQQLKSFSSQNGDTYEKIIKKSILQTYNDADNTIMQKANKMQMYHRNNTPSNKDLMKKKKSIQDRITKRYKKIIDYTFPPPPKPKQVQEENEENEDEEDEEDDQPNKKQKINELQNQLLDIQSENSDLKERIINLERQLNNANNKNHKLENQINILRVKEAENID